MDETSDVTYAKSIKIQKVELANPKHSKYLGVTIRVFFFCFLFFNPSKAEIKLIRKGLQSES